MRLCRMSTERASKLPKRGASFGAAAAASWQTRAAEAIQACEVLYITAGAGMSADCGLPTFRSKEGFWRAYPPAQKAGLSFAQVSNPASFERDERLAWGFFGHRYHLYTNAQPHEGYHILKRWADRIGKHFVFTSNVDGMFERAGFSSESIYECHGSIHYIQARHPVEMNEFGIIPASETTLPSLDIDEHFRAKGELPKIDGLDARPNILMFGDYSFLDRRTDEQADLKDRFISQVPNEAKIVIVEVGAGMAVPTVRYESEDILANFPSAILIRINVDESHGPSRTISVPETGLLAIKAIDDLLSTSVSSREAN